MGGINFRQYIVRDDAKAGSGIAVGMEIGRRRLGRRRGGAAALEATAAIATIGDDQRPGHRVGSPGQDEIRLDDAKHEPLATVVTVGRRFQF